MKTETSRRTHANLRTGVETPVHSKGEGELPSRVLRARIRSGEFTQPTGGQAPGFVQANLVVVPQAYAFDFLLFCQRNPKPCPLLEVVEAGSVEPKRLAPGADIRTDLPRYRVFRNGEMAEERTDVTDLWRDDFVSFLLGCSFSFEKPLQEAGLEVRYLTQGTNVAMYRTSIPCRPAGVFGGPMVVSMRPFNPQDALKATLITAAFPQVHGAPVHQGDSEKIGIRDLAVPDYGDPQELRPGEVPVFWACGVTPQAALTQAKLPLAITHAPGHMFVSDIREEDLRWLNESVR
ncbi:MAG: putative hydro-lyase [Deltaproteobacteria bacterium]|nr:putative hydro-lyase [Deltaproteobacteria bacterium]